MVYLPNIRRKYVQEQVIPSGAGAWADFNLSKLGSFISSVQLTDSTAGSNSTNPLRCYNMLPFGADGDSLLINAQLQGHAYVYGFSNGHSFELPYLNNSFSSRTGYYSSFYGIFPLPDGGSFYNFYSGNAIYWRPMSIAYNLSNVGNNVLVFNSYNGGIIESPNCSFLSSDGLSLFYKSFESDYLYCVRLPSAWPQESTGFATLKKFALTDFESTIGLASSETWRCFMFSPDGKCAIFSTTTNLVKFVLSVPWDFSTAVVHSHKAISGLTLNGSSVTVGLGGMAVNPTGTKLILHNRANSATNAGFYDFALVA